VGWTYLCMWALHSYCRINVHVLEASNIYLLFHVMACLLLQSNPIYINVTCALNCLFADASGVCNEHRVCSHSDARSQHMGSRFLRADDTSGRVPRSREHHDYTSFGWFFIGVGKHDRPVAKYNCYLTAVKLDKTTHRETGGKYNLVAHCKTHNFKV